jgi:uncharacterized protein with HEPN domain
MKPGERDAAYLWDMLDAARRAQRLTEGMDFADFVDDERTSLAVERLLENIGEAAAHLSSGFLAAHPAIPWKAMVGMRNVLAHQYGSVDQKLVWESIVSGVPTLISFLEPLTTDTN